MALSLLAHEVSDLCLGKPALKPLSVSSTVADALAALKSSEDDFISVWDCEHSGKIGFREQNDDVGCRCVGKLCMVDVICYLCKEENVLDPSAALRAPVSAILPKIPDLVMHLESSSRYFTFFFFKN